MFLLTFNKINGLIFGRQELESLLSYFCFLIIDHLKVEETSKILKYFDLEITRNRLQKRLRSWFFIGD